MLMLQNKTHASVCLRCLRHKFSFMEFQSIGTLDSLSPELVAAVAMAVVFVTVVMVVVVVVVVTAA